MPISFSSCVNSERLSSPSIISIIHVPQIPSVHEKGTPNFSHASFICSFSFTFISFPLSEKIIFAMFIVHLCDRNLKILGDFHFCNKHKTTEKSQHKPLLCLFLYASLVFRFLDFELSF